MPVVPIPSYSWPASFCAGVVDGAAGGSYRNRLRQGWSSAADITIERTGAWRIGYTGSNRNRSGVRAGVESVCPNKPRSSTNVYVAEEKYIIIWIVNHPLKYGVSWE